MRDDYSPGYRVSAAQIVMIFLLMALVASFWPVVADAVTGSSINITDPESRTKKVQVTGTGELASTICDPVTAPGTGSCARVAGGKLKIGDGSGPLTVNGAVAARPDTDPTAVKGLTSALTNSDSVQGLFGPLASGASIALTDLVFANTGTTNLDVSIAENDPPENIPVESPGNCGIVGTANQRLKVAVKAGETVTVSFEHPLILSMSTGDPWCVTAFVFSFADPGSELWVTGIGFTP